MTGRRSPERASYRRTLGIELLHAHFVTHAFMPHVHEGFALGVIETGAEEYRYRGSRLVAPSGSVVLIPPGEAHTGAAAVPSGWAYRMAYPHPSWLQEAHEALGRRGVPGFRASVIHDPVLAAQLRRALLALAEGRDMLQAETLWREALEMLVGRHSERPGGSAPRPERVAVRRALELLEADPAGVHRLSELAAAIGLTPTSLSRSFRQQLGLSPHAYVLGLRVRLARRLLEGGESIARAALEAGFADQAHLSRVFKRVVGVPPGAAVRAEMYKTPLR